MAEQLDQPLSRSRSRWMRWFHPARAPRPPPSPSPACPASGSVQNAHTIPAIHRFFPIMSS